jgi:Transglutaminase-like superfamily
MTTTGILKPQNKQKVYYENGKTVDIQSVIFEVNQKEIWKQTENFSRQFSKDCKGLRDLWHFVKDNITYQEDPIGFQYVQHPAALWKSKVGDCKSFTLFIVSVLQNLGIPYIIRFTSYRKGDVTHVYPVAILDDTEVILDAVWDYFDDEKDYFRKEDFKFQKKMSQIVEISGIGAARSVAETAAAFRAATRDIPESILEKNDVTKMTQAEFYRFLGYTVPVSGIGSLETTPAFRAPILEFDSVGNLTHIGFSLNDAWKKVKETATKVKDAVVNAAQKVAEALKKGWQLLVNWVFKVALPAASPFFLYTFLSKKLSSKIEAKKAKQESVINWISSVSGTDKTQITATIRAALTAKLGKQPELVINEAAKPSVYGVRIGFIAELIDVAMPFLIELITKIGDLFKKPAPKISRDDAGSQTEIEDANRQSDNTASPAGTPKKVVVPFPSPANYEEGTDSIPAPNRPSRSPSPNSSQPQAASSDNSGMMIAAAVAGAFYLFM